MQVTIHTDARRTAAAFAGAAPLLTARLRTTVRNAGSLLRTRVRANASGRTGAIGTSLGGHAGEIGPRVQTGDYRRSIALATRTDSAGGEFAAEVGTNAPQGRRLEEGFIGADSLGRTYQQPPLPHFGPAATATADTFAKDVEADVDFVDHAIGTL